MRPTSFLAVLALLASASSAALAQGITLEPNTIYGAIRFDNTNPAVLSILANEGARQVVVSADSTSPGGFSSYTTGTTTSDLGGTYILSAESNGGVGQVTYNVGVTVYTGGLTASSHGSGGFYFPTQSGVILNPPPAAGDEVDFDTTVGVEHITFGTDSTCATPVVIGSASISFYYGGGASIGSFSDGYALIPGGVSTLATVSITVGTDDTLNTFVTDQTLTLSAGPDAIEELCVVVPTGGNGSSLGTIQTPFQVVGQTLINPEGYIEAYDLDGSGNNRYTYLAGDAPASSPAIWPTLVNLLPGSYELYGYSIFGLGDAQTQFSPGYTNNLPAPVQIAVTAGTTTDASQPGPVYPFVMHPASLNGNVFLYDRFVALNPGAPSTMNYLGFSTDWYQAGYPAGETVRGPAGDDTHLYSYSYNGSSAYSYSSFSGRFSPTLGTLTTSYTLPVMQAYDQPATWDQPVLQLFWYNEGGDYFAQYAETIPPDWDYHYYYGYIDPTDPNYAQREENFRLGDLSLTTGSGGDPSTALLGPGDTSNLDHRYCFGEVQLQYTAAAGSGSFINPSVSISGGFTGTDFEGNSVAYSGSGAFYGVPWVGPDFAGPPDDLASRSTTGYVSMALATGSWNLSPSASFVNNDGTYSVGNFSNTNVNVQCGQRIIISPGFSISINVATSGCSTTPTPTVVSGEVIAGDATIDRIWYTVGSTTIEYCGVVSGVTCPVSTTGTPAPYSFTVAAGLTGPITVYASSPYVPNPASATDTILSCNYPPTVTCGSITAASNATVTLTPVGSDPNGDALIWSWSGPGGITLSGSGTGTPTFTAPIVTTATTYTFTATVSDGQASDSAVCTVTVEPPTNPCVAPFDTQAPVPDVISLPTIADQCSATVTAPTATDNCAGTVTGTTSDPLSYTSPGTYIVHWSYSDGNGNTSTQNQTVLVQDTTAPVPDVASLPALTGACSLTPTPPTATDNCNGEITATTTTPFPVTAQGTTTILWTYSDSEGNTSTQTQTVTLSANTPAGTNISLSSPPGYGPSNLSSPNASVTVTFSDVTSCGNTTFTLTPSACVLSGYQTTSAVGGCYVIETTATYTGPITIAMTYPPSSTEDASHGKGELLMTLEHVVSGSPTNITNPSCRGNVVYNTTTNNGNAAATQYLPYCNLLDGNGDGVALNNDGGELIGTTYSLSPFFSGFVFELANAGPAQLVNALSTVTLDGTGDQAPQNALLSYSWVQLSGPSVTLTGADTATPSFTAPEQAYGSQSVLVFQLTTTDPTGGSSSDSVAITVQEVGPPPPPVAVPTAGPSTVCGDQSTQVTLNGSGSTDPNGSAITSYLWTALPNQFLTNPLGPFTSASPTVTFPAPQVTQATMLTFALEVTDALGISSTNSNNTVSIYVKDVNEAPIANAGSNQTVTQGSTVVLSGADSFDPDSDPITYSWKQTGGPSVCLSGSGRSCLGTSSQESPAFTAPQLSQCGEATTQTLTFQLTVTDQPSSSSSCGGALTSKVSTVTITDELPDHPPVANAGRSQTVNDGSLVTLDGSQSYDPDRDPITYNWQQLSGPTATLSSTAVAKPTFIAPMVPVGSSQALVFQLTVTDPSGMSSSDAVTVTDKGLVAPPDCDGAYASTTVLYPPQHQMTNVSILGVKDPYDSNVQIAITSVTQDEPTTGTCHGDTPIDSVINNDGSCLLRAEHGDQTGDRTYYVNFTATDRYGNCCKGQVTVGAPQTSNGKCASRGQLFDSTR